MKPHFFLIKISASSYLSKQRCWAIDYTSFLLFVFNFLFLSAHTFLNTSLSKTMTNSELFSIYILIKEKKSVTYFIQARNIKGMRNLWSILFDNLLTWHPRQWIQTIYLIYFKELLVLHIRVRIMTKHISYAIKITRRERYIAIKYINYLRNLKC